MSNSEETISIYNKHKIERTNSHPLETFDMPDYNIGGLMPCITLAPLHPTNDTIMETIKKQYHSRAYIIYDSISLAKYPFDIAVTMSKHKCELWGMKAFFLLESDSISGKVYHNVNFREIDECSNIENPCCDVRAAYMVHNGLWTRNDDLIPEICKLSESEQKEYLAR